MRPEPIASNARLYQDHLKQQWHRQVLSRLADLAKALGIRQYQRRSLKGGAVYSGSATLQSASLSSKRPTDPQPVAGKARTTTPTPAASIARVVSKAEITANNMAGVAPHLAAKHKTK